jgi:predicted nucleic acid-binding protein
MANIVCLDTHVLIWGIGEYGTKGQEPMIDRTKRFIKYLDNQKSQILLPSVIVAEFLMSAPPEQHPTITNLLERTFMVAPFDTQAAAMYSRIWQDKKGKGIVKQIQSGGSTREVIKVDCMLVSIAVVRGASIIYSHDQKGVAKIAEGYIDVSEVPDIPQQQNLFEEV